MGLCVDIPCTADTVVADCPKTFVCAADICSTCAITAGSTPTTNCPDDYWCTASTGACYAGECTVATQDTDCTTITESCNGENLLCEQQTCAANSDCRSLLCAAATADSNCITCADTAACQDATTGGDATYFCDATSSACFLETCTGATTDPVAADTCATVVNSCQNGACAVTTGCTADANTCRSGATGDMMEGVCNAGTCEACARTTTDDVTTSNCPGPQAYCVIDNVTTGNYCTMSTCAADAATMVEGQTMCDAWTMCNVAGTGACDAISCTVALDCDTLVCNTATCA